MSALVRAGLVPRSYLLTTRGRKTGQARTNPVVPVEHGGRRWLVAPYGPVPWVDNAGATGRVSLARRRDRGSVGAVDEHASQRLGFHRGDVLLGVALAVEGPGRILAAVHRGPGPPAAADAVPSLPAPGCTAGPSHFC